ncbi:hypothetical protein ACHAWF_002350 [Thalassiosira exigua]
MALAEGHVGAAIGLVCIAGAASAVGSSVVFFPKLVKLTSRRVLAASLGLSAGVMLYISFADIFIKSVDSFAEGGIDQNNGYAYATLSFFGGVCVSMILDSCIRRFSRDHEPLRREQDEDLDIEIDWNQDYQETNENEQQEPTIAHYCIGCSNDPAAELSEWHDMADLELQERQEDVPPVITIGRKPSATTATIAADEENGCRDSLETKTSEPGDKAATIVLRVENVPRSPDEDLAVSAPTYRVHPLEEKRKLVKMSFSTALAISLHNFPEGLATFVTALDDPGVGAVLATAIALHNIPEGMCVSLPIYYATGDRWKAFLWGCLAGISEPIAALLGWLVLAKVLADSVLAVLFGLVGGMMVMISLREMIPAAHRYDPEDTVVTYSIVTGMAVMALALVLMRL